MANVVNRKSHTVINRVNAKDFPVQEWIHNYTLDHMEDIPKEYWITDGNIVREMTEEEKYIVDNMDLEGYKKEKYVEVDTNTQKLIYQGFEHAGIIFSLSQGAQLSWNSMLTWMQVGALSFPSRISSIDDTKEYFIQSPEELMMFIGKAFYEVEKNITTGRHIKMAISEQITKAKVDRLVDIRTKSMTVEELDYHIAHVLDDGDSSVTD